MSDSFVSNFLLLGRGVESVSGPLQRAPLQAFDKFFHGLEAFVSGTDILVDDARLFQHFQGLPIFVLARQHAADIGQYIGLP